MNETRELAATPGLPIDSDGPIFDEPWQAQAFAMTLALYENGLFSWSEWTTALAGRIARASAAGDPDNGDTYYLHWLAALEDLITDKGVADRAALADLRTAWDRAARNTPHGQQIVLDDSPPTDSGS